jgi:hypothetical protein
MQMMGGAPGPSPAQLAALQQLAPGGAMPSGAMPAPGGPPPPPPMGGGPAGPVPMGGMPGSGDPWTDAAGQLFQGMNALLQATDPASERADRLSSIIREFAMLMQPSAKPQPEAPPGPPQMSPMGGPEMSPPQ